MACENGLVYYIIGIATLASGMTIFWVGYIDHFEGGLHLEDDEPALEQSNFFNWHVTMMMWPFVMCATLAVTIFRKIENQKLAKILHVAFHTVAIVAAWSAFTLGYMTNEAKKYGHFSSFHSYVGMMTLVLYTMNFIAGALFYGLQVVSATTRDRTIAFHRALGLSAYGFMLLSIFLGMLQKANYGGVYADCTSDELTPDQKDECVLKINLVNWSSIVMCFGITFLVYYLTNPAYSRSVQKQLNQVMPSNETDMESLNKDAAF